MSSTTMSDTYTRLPIVILPLMPVYKVMPSRRNCYEHLFRVCRGRAHKYGNIQNVPVRQVFTETVYFVSPDGEKNVHQIE